MTNDVYVLWYIFGAFMWSVFSGVVAYWLLNVVYAARTRVESIRPLLGPLYRK